MNAAIIIASIFLLSSCATVSVGPVEPVKNLPDYCKHRFCYGPINKTNSKHERR